LFLSLCKYKYIILKFKLKIMILQNSIFLEIGYEPENELIWDIWQAETINMKDDDFKVEISAWRDAIVTYKIKNALIDTTHFMYSIAPKIQEWVDENITKATVEAGLQKMAFLVSNEIFSQVSIEQTMDEKSGTLL